jgi:putative phosphotransacetylase
LEQIIEAVLSAIPKAGLVEVEVSARHVHLSTEDLKILFGKDAGLTYKRDLSQPGQFLAQERVNLIGPKGRKDKVAVLGPVRKDTQVELSKSDCVELGVKAPVRESGNVENSGSIQLEGPCGTLEITDGVIIAHRHIHVPQDIANTLGLSNKQKVSVQVFSERPVILKDVIVRVSDMFRFRMHIDFDEANAAALNGFTLGRIIKG